MINVIKASAGSGKTYQLTYEYIKLLLGEKRKGRYVLARKGDRERHRHILAVTFTNKATGEMKERIVKELSVLAGKENGKRSPYMDDLCRDFGNVSETDVEQAANRALVELLFDYSNFNVSTIDSFFQMVLRTFAKELKISYNYDIELNDEYAIKVGVNDFLSSLAHERGATPNSIEAKRVRRAKAWIKEFVRDEVTNKKSWNIFSDSETFSSSSSRFSRSFSFNDFAKCLTKEELKYRIDDIVAYLGYDGEETSSDYISLFKGEVYRLIQSVKEEAVKAREEIMRLCENDGLQEDALSSNGGLKWLLKISADNIDCGLGEAKTAKIIESAGKGDRWFKKGKGKNAPRLSEETKSAVAGLIGVIACCNSRFLIYKEIHRNVFMLGLLGEISHYLSKFRKENDLILLADTNELLRKIINNDETPFVYERVGMWLSHFLIDEFQDTSKAQWENMKPLLFNSCAEGCDNLIIGDEKQCIYRFRNADPTLLRTEVGRNFTVMQNDDGRCVNWRSTPRVVEFNNLFFSKISEILNVKDVYGNVAQDLPPAGAKRYVNDGYVEVSFIGGDATNEDESVLKFSHEALKRLPKLIHDVLSRGYKQSDIAVLVSTNSQGTDVINRILDYNTTREEGEPVINVVSNESLMLKNSPAIRLIISHLRYLDTKMFVGGDSGEQKRYKDIDGYMHRVLRNYESLMFKEGKEPGEALEESFAKVPRYVGAVDMSLSSLLPDNTESFNLVSITEHIIAQNISEEDLENENAFIQAFQDSVVDFSSRFNATLHEFLKWWDRGGCNTSVNSPDGQNAINVLTIHKSKGLEYKCVILPFCDWDMNGKDEVLWLPKNDVLQSGLFSGMPSEIIPPIMPLMPKADMDLEGNGLKEFYEEKMQSRQIDSLNRTYVAFTRAVDELYVFTPSLGQRGTSDTSMNTLLSETLLQGDGCTFTSGVKGVVLNELESKGKPEMEKMPLYKVRDARIEYTVPDLLDNENRKRGTRLHNVFRRIRYREDADAALAYYKVRGVFPRGIYDDECKIVKDALSDKRVQEWFDRKNKVYNERSMVHAFKKKRPDRFVTTPDGRNIVIDYKFGDIHSISYKKQVEDYMDILSEIGFNNLEGYLWYPLERKIEKVK